MSNVQDLQPPGASRRGRPRLAPADPSTLEVLGIPQARAFCKKQGRSLGRDRLVSAIARGELLAFEDTLCLDKLGKPLLKVRRVDLQRWLEATLRPVKPFAAALASGGL